MLESSIAKVLFTYHITPHSTTGREPAELLLGRIPSTQLDLLFPSPAIQVEEKQSHQKRAHDTTALARSLAIGRAVFVLNFPAGNTRIPARVITQAGPVSFIVQLEDRRQVKQHQDHLRPRLEDTPLIVPAQDSGLGVEFFPLTPTTQPVEASPKPVENEPPRQPLRRYPQRDRRAPTDFRPRTHPTPHIKGRGV